MRNDRGRSARPEQVTLALSGAPRKHRNRCARDMPQLPLPPSRLRAPLENAAPLTPSIVADMEGTEYEPDDRIVASTVICTRDL